MLIAAGCTQPEQEQVRWLVLDQVRPENHKGVFLNERIQMHFTEPLDPTSVNPHSVKITSSHGRPARGEWQVDEDGLIFVPDPVLAFDLSDGGYQPAETYFVDLAGFPRPDGLRGRSGAPLEHNLRWEFRTVEVTEPRDYVFEDSSLSRALPVILRSPEIAPGDPIVLEGEEPLDPSTLFGEDFVLRRERLEDQKGRVRAPLSEPIPLHARLSSNFDKATTHGRGTTLVELTPVNRLLEPGTYYLAIDADRFRLKDFGGNRVPVWIRGPRGRPEIIVRPRTTSSSDVSSEFLASFLDDRMRSLEALESLDGTAYWGNSGRVEIHWPAAAGWGVDGAVTLGAAEARVDIQATRLVLPEGVNCELSSSAGLRVVRAQGKLTIAGTLARHAPLATGAGPSVDGRELFERGDTLSRCLERMRARDFNATVIIAGGDLIIDGRIDCDGPLLLVAGGRIRAARADCVAARWLYCAGDGAGSLKNPRGPEAIDLRDRYALALDTPTENQLVETLRFGVVSRSIPPEGRAVRWHVGPQVGAHGSVRVRYVGEPEASDAAGGREIVVDDPGALTDCPTLRLRVELTLWPAQSWRAPSLEGDFSARRRTLRKLTKWDPPWVDYVLLQLDQAPARNTR